MRGMQGELADSGEEPCEPRHHGVEHVCEPIELISVVCSRQPLLEVIEVDALGGLCESGHRCQRCCSLPLKCSPPAMSTRETSSIPPNQRVSRLRMVMRLPSSDSQRHARC